MKRTSDSTSGVTEGATLHARLGRAAHRYGLAAAVAFVVNSAFLYAEATGRLPDFPVQYVGLVVALVPLAAGAALASHALMTKWRPYRGRRRSGDFVLTIVAILFSSAFAAAVVLVGLGVLPSLAPIVVYPSSVTGIALVQISIALAWPGHEAGKVGSIVAALGLPGIMTARGILGTYPAAPSGPGEVLLFVMLYLGCALLAEVSGSALRVLAVSAVAGERQILADDSREADLRELQRALSFRQEGVNRREAAIEAHQQEVRAEASRVEAQRQELERLQASAEAREKEIRDVESKLAETKAEADARWEQIKLREADLARVALNIEETRKATASRSEALAEAEKEATRKAVEAEAAKRALSTRLKDLEEQGDRLRLEQGRLKKSRREFLKLEKDLQLRESQLVLRLAKAQAAVPEAKAEQTAEGSDWESTLREKEKALAQHEVDQRAVEVDLKERSDMASRMESRIQEERKGLQDKEDELIAREMATADRETRMRRHASQIDAEQRALEDQARRLTERENEYVQLIKDVRMKEANAATNQEEIAKRLAAMDRRQKMIDDKDASVRNEFLRLSEEKQHLIEAKKALEQREQELPPRQFESTRSSRKTPEARLRGFHGLGREEDSGGSEGRVRERDDEPRNSWDEKEVGREPDAEAGAHPEGTGNMDEVVVDGTKREKVRTGTGRLDELLNGGIPLPANFLVSGPAFAGGEVLLLTFVAEGLKKGVPAVIVATSKPPVEIAKDIAPILPTFGEYEQLGLVFWIDGSRETKGGKVTREGTTFKVNGPRDYDNILRVLGEIDEICRQRYPHFRLAYVSLSGAIAHGDPNAGLSFVQRCVSRVRRANAVAGYAIDRGLHTDQQLEALEHLVDGAIRCKAEKQLTMLQIVGFGDVQTRDWVPYKFTNRAVMIGSFQLERIR